MGGDSLVVSTAAIANLTVPSTLPESDPLLSLVISLTNPIQLSVKAVKPPKKGKAPSPELSIRGGTVTVTQRNAILRSLCGTDLHAILDNAPFYMLGGHAVAAAQIPESSFIVASISSWMSVASTLTKDSVQKTLGDLESGPLSSQSFLIKGVGSPTLADFDLYFSLLKILNTHFDSPLKNMLSSTPNVHRWWTSVSKSVEYFNKLASPKSKVKLDSKDLETITSSYECTPVESPKFYFGEEGEDLPTFVAPTPAPSKATFQAKKQGGDAGGKGGELTEEQKKAAAEKRAKKKAEKAKKKPKGGGGGGGGNAGGELDISALDIRVGKILKAWNHEEAEKLYCEEVDVGEETGPRKIASGLRPFYKLEEMQNRSVLVLCNLKARNLVGFPSHGMVMCASNTEHTKVEFVCAPEGAKIGERVSFESIEMKDPESENKMNKKKIFEKLAPDLKTDENGVIVWKGKKASVSSGECKAINGMANGHVA